MKITPQPLTRKAFAPFGDVLDIPAAAGRIYYDEALGDLRSGAMPSLSIALTAPTADRPFASDMLERHEFSSQTFIPIDVGRWLIVVAPGDAHGRPDIRKALAFIADGRVGVTYRANTWHHGLTTLDKSGSFAIFMWKAGVQDEEFVRVEPFTVHVSE